MIEATIRECRSEDLDAVAAIEREVVEEGTIVGFVPSGDLAARLNGYFFVAELDAEVVGFICAAVKVNEDLVVLPKGEKYLEIEDLTVARDHRNGGIGGRLLDRVLELAADSGVVHGLLYSASRDLDSVVRFYRRHGFATWNVMMYR